MRTIDHSYISSDLSETTLLRSNRRILDNLLSDRTTNKNIRWGTDNYSYLGSDYSEDKEIKVGLITGWHDGLIQPRANKANDVQLARTRNRAEVFTPSWIVEKQVNAVLDDMLDIDLEQFLSTKWLEITCGEGPYMVNRYDMISGNIIPLKERAGFIDRKFRRLNQEIEDFNEWLQLAIIIYQSSYGYEYQGDSLLLARENLLLTFMDNFFYMFGAVPPEDVQLHITDIISKNVFQMDGLTYQVPYSDDGRESVQLSLFEEIEEGSKEPMMATTFLWEKEQVVNFIDLVGGSSEMRFDVVIGNPPFQEELESTSDRPIYPYFMDSAYELADKVILITLGRFLFNAGKTSKKWNQKMLNDRHLKVLFYEDKSQRVFQNTNFRGGVAITYRDKSKIEGPIEVFTIHDELNNILYKVKSESNLSDIVFAPESYKFNEKFHEVYPKAKNKLSKGHKNDLTSNIFERLPNLFKDSITDSKKYIRILGREDKERTFKYIEDIYIVAPENLQKYKLFVAKANGSGSFGEVLSSPIIGKPGEGHTQTFLSIGSFDNKFEGESCLKYVKTKFTRALLSVLKVTQDNKKRTWKKIPLQDFTSNSDIDWSKSVAEIDQQLYAKYGLNEEEINFIETNVKEMV
ncbi:Eco57I restriction-modification methylase domain-containing protein [Ignavigranum ruoffiae]|uniref:Eco57I restriction-modification methylase domain-containing protein n=1 Tax=Ignavigranum ruoffiae TaxID=89093 RepID=UPI0024AE3A9C|nr:Eco57I restriction-modification methylase domain-containing protein [Ignavigranum ruoffiae]